MTSTHRLVPLEPDVSQERTLGARMLTAARALTVTDVPTHRQALEGIAAARKGLAAAEELLRPNIKRWSDGHKAALALLAEVTEPLRQAATILSAKAGIFEDIERGRADAERRRLEVEAAKQAEERRLAEAVHAEQMGEPELADEILAEPPAPAPIIRVEPQVAKVEGLSSRRTWVAEIVDMEALFAWIAQDRSRIAYAEPEALRKSHPSLNALARAQRASLSVPGVRAVEQVSRAYRQSREEEPW